MSDDAQPAKRVSRRMYLLWAAALTLLLTTALSCWLVVVPFVHASRVVNKYADYLGPCAPFLNVPGRNSAEARAVRELGGKTKAVKSLGLYMRAPAWLAERKAAAAWVLKECGPEAIPILNRARDDFKPNVRDVATQVLNDIRVEAKEDSQ